MNKASRHICCLFISVILSGMAACLIHREEVRPNDFAHISRNFSAVSIHVLLPHNDDSLELTSASGSVPAATQGQWSSAQGQKTAGPAHGSDACEVDASRAIISSEAHEPDVSGLLPRQADYYVFTLGRILV